MSSSSDDDDSDSIGSVRSRPESPSVRRVRSRDVTLAKIFMRTLSYSDPIIAEWDGKDPGYTKQLFVYAYIDNTTCQSYVTLSSEREKRRKHSLYDKNYDSLMHGGPFSTYVQSCIHNPLSYDPGLYPNSPELATLLPNLMSGSLSFVNSRELRDRHRIYVFDPPPTMGIESNRHHTVTNPVYTYWYKLNNLSGRDNVTQGPPHVETIRDIPEEEFDLNYRIFQNFRLDNPDRTVFGREPQWKHGEPLKQGIPNPNIRRTNYRPRHDPNRGRGNVHGHSRGPSGGGKKNSKRRNKTRRKYRKIKSRRRRVIR
jgi:hypothetical protein